MRSAILGIGFFVSLGAQAAPLGVAPGVTSLPQAKALFGEPQSTPIAEARYRFSAPTNSGVSAIELYVGRQSSVVELAEYLYEPAAEAATLRTQLKQKEPDLHYTTVAGETCEVYLASRVRLLLNKDGKVRAADYLSVEAMRLLLTEVAPLTADRSTIEGAYRALVAALFLGREVDLTATLGGAKSAAGLEIAFLQKVQPEFLFVVDGAAVVFPASKAKAKEASVKLNHPLYGAVELVFASTDKGWLLSRVSGLGPEPIEKTATTPRAALRLYLKSLNAMPIASAKPTTPAPITTAAEAAWGKEWHDVVQQMSITRISLEATPTIFLAGDGKEAYATLKQENKLWRVLEIAPQEKK